MKKNYCPNTYFNREISGYVSLLLSADALLASLENAYGSDPDKALKVSRELDFVIAGIMSKRGTVAQLLLADSAFN